MDAKAIEQMVEQQYAEAVAMVRKYGHMVVHFEGYNDVAQAAFTIGAAKYGRPDLIIYGLPIEVAKTSLNTAFKLVADRWPFPTKTALSGIMEGYDCILRDVTRSPLRERKMGLATMFNRRQGFPDNPIFQVCWPDKDGNYPWDPKCSPAVAELQRVRGLAS